MMSPFQPRGSRALRVIVAELAVQRGMGGLLTFEELGLAIGTHDRAIIRQAVSAARHVLLLDHQMALVAKRGVGYRVAEAGEFAGIAQDHRRKSDRAITKAVAYLDNAPVEQMSPDELKRHRAVSVAIHNLHGRMTSAEQRLADLEAAVYGPPRKVIQGKAEET